MMDFETAAKISGTRFVFLKSFLARLERVYVILSRYTCKRAWVPRNKYASFSKDDALLFNKTSWL